MSQPAAAPSPYFVRHREVLLWAALLYAAWTGTWLVYEAAATAHPMLRAHEPATLWWNACKLVVWLAPVLLLVWRRRGDERLVSWLGLDHVRGLGRGALAMVGIVAIFAAIDAAVPGRWPTPPSAPHAWHLVLLIGVLGPFLEEVLFRGYALRAFQEGGSGFWRANLESAVLFALLHVPGWLFMGQSPGWALAMTPQIIFSGFLIGAFRARGGSLWAAVLMHIVNNAWSGGWFLVLSS